MTYHAIQWIETETGTSSGALRLLDQRQLPQTVGYIDYHDYREVAQAIREMVVRGAPAIGITAAYGMALAALESHSSDGDTLRGELDTAAGILRAARPTAVNLFWAVERVLDCVGNATLTTADEIRKAALAEAHTIAEIECQSNFQIGQNALPLVPDKAKFIHHCNTGPLATGEYGTALGVIWAAHKAGKDVYVYVDETRPRLQGARLTAWELQQMGIPHTVIVDGAAAHIMRTRGVDLCVVGCDRVAANGDTANKIGTYALALSAYAHGVPFYVVGPLSSIDFSLDNGDLIEIEERNPQEVTHIRNYQITPGGSSATNIAFDVTPAKYITAIITDKGIAYPPFEVSLAALKTVGA